MSFNFHFRVYLDIWESATFIPIKRSHMKLISRTPFLKRSLIEVANVRPSHMKPANISLAEKLFVSENNTWFLFFYLLIELISTDVIFQCFVFIFLAFVSRDLLIYQEITIVKRILAWSPVVTNSFNCIIASIFLKLLCVPGWDLVRSC